MAAMAEKDVLKAFQEAVKAAVAASTFPTLPINFLDVNFTIPNHGKWLEIVRIVNNIPGQTWGNERMYQGIYRLILHWPKQGGGAYDPLDLVGSVASYFTQGKNLFSGAIRVNIYQKAEFTGELDAPGSSAHRLFPVSIPYRCFQPT